MFSRLAIFLRRRRGALVGAQQVDERHGLSLRRKTGGMAPTGPGEGGRSGPGGCCGCGSATGRRGSGVQNAGALPCPRAFRPAGRVRSDLSSSVTASPPGSRGLCAPTRGGAPARSGVGVVLDLRGRSTRCVREGRASPERLMFDSVPGNGGAFRLLAFPGLFQAGAPQAVVRGLLGGGASCPVPGATIGTACASRRLPSP